MAGVAGVAALWVAGAEARGRVEPRWIADPALVRAVEEALALEPAIEEVIGRALVVWRARTGGRMARSAPGWSAALPDRTRIWADVSDEAWRQTESEQDWTAGAEAGGLFLEDEGRDATWRGAEKVRVGASLEWDLTRLVWHPDTLRIEESNRRAQEAEDRFRDQVAAAWYERRQLQLLLSLSPPQDTREAIAARLRLDRLTGMLDGWTDGWFGRALSP